MGQTDCRVLVPGIWALVGHFRDTLTHLILINIPIRRWKITSILHMKERSVKELGHLPKITLAHKVLLLSWVPTALSEWPHQQINKEADFKFKSQYRFCVIVEEWTQCYYFQERKVCKGCYWLGAVEGGNLNIRKCSLFWVQTGLYIILICWSFYNLWTYKKEYHSSSVR